MCLQETWLIDQTLYKLGNVHDNYLYHGKSGIDSTSAILKGRPYGGVAILYKKNIAKYVTSIDISYIRVCGIILKLSSGYSILVLCVYMSCDNYSNTNVNDNFVCFGNNYSYI